MSPQRDHQLGEFLIGRLRHKPIVPQANTRSPATRRQRT